MSFQDLEIASGWRPVFNSVPYTKNMALKTHLPLGFFYSPFLGEPTVLKASPSYCSKCKAALSIYAQRNKQARRWNCNLCGTDNPFIGDYGNAKVQQYIQNKAGDNGIFFIIDLCVSDDELASIKQTIIKTIQKLPQNIFVGVMAFNRNIHLYDFSDPLNQKFVCLGGDNDYSVNNYTKLKQSLGLLSNVDPRHATKVILSKYYVPLAHNEKSLIAAIQSLQAESYFKPRQLRQQRANGCALQIAISLISTVGINTRFIAIIGGPCTVGPGKVVDLPLKKTIRVYMDIFEGSQNANYVKVATKFYQSLQKILVQNKNTLDIWAYGVDQFGLYEMKNMVNSTGGMLAMHELFNHFIFQTSFEKFYEANEEGMFKFAIASQLSIRLSKQMKINGIIGLCKSLKQNTLKTASQVQIGQGGTNVWYLGGIPENNSQCIFLSHSQLSQNKQRGLFLQAIYTYKFSDNIFRTRVSTIFVEYLRQPQIRQMMRGFDQQAASVMLARMATKKSEIEQTTEVKKWLDRTLLKFTVRFAIYSRYDTTSFKLPMQMKHFPQFMYHLRRSGFINPFGSPPDQSIYVKTCMQRQSIANCMVMIQPALLRYSTEQLDPVSVELDMQQLKDDVVLLLDTYFNVLVWYGEHIKGWKDQKLNQDPQYQYLNDLFNIPIEDAGQLMYDRLPVSNFYETFKYDGKQRYLKSRVNPSLRDNQNSDGHIITDDAPIKLFMDFLIKSVVNYSQ